MVGGAAREAVRARGAWRPDPTAEPDGYGKRKPAEAIGVRAAAAVHTVIISPIMRVFTIHSFPRSTPLRRG